MRPASTTKTPLISKRGTKQTIKTMYFYQGKCSEDSRSFQKEPI